MSLIRRISIGFTVALIGLVVLTALTTILLTSVRQQISEVWQETGRGDSLRQMEGELALYEANLDSYILTGEASQLTAAREQRAALAQAVTQFNQNSPRALADVPARLRALDQIAGQLVALHQDRGAATNPSAVVGQFHQQVNDLTAELAGTRRSALTRAQSERDAISGALVTGTAAVVVIGAFLFLVALGAVILLARSVTRQLRVAIGAIAAASGQFDESAKHQASGSSAQAAAVSEVTATMEELSQTAEQIARSSEFTLESAESGRLAVGDTLEGMDRIKLKAEAMTRRIRVLGDRSQQIGEIIEIINDIADKTHLLAINAAIESAAAGEYGRRFAVVAEQVKELSDESKGATKQVKRIVGEIQGATGALVVATEEATREVDAGSQLAQRAGNAIEEIVQMIHTISLATEQQRGASAQVVFTMHDIAAVARDSAEGSAQAADSASRLSSTANQLRQLIGGAAL